MRDDLLEEVHGGVLALIGPDGRVAEAGVIVDTDMQAFPPGAPHLVAAIAGHPMARPLDAPELLDVEVEQFARMVPLVAHHRGWRRSRPMPAQDPAERGLREAGLLADLGIGQALLPPAPDFLALGFRDPLRTAVRPGTAILQAG